MEKIHEKNPCRHLIGKLQNGQTITHNGNTIKPEEVSITSPARKVAYVTDTKLCNACYTLAERADILISESSFLQSDEEKAVEYNHLTAQQAGLLASKSGVRDLYLFHISSRYANTTPILEEASRIHPRTFIARDFQTIHLDKAPETKEEKKELNAREERIIDEETPEEQAHREESRKVVRRRVTLKKKKRCVGSGSWGG